MATMTTYYAFAAKGIQSYILHTDKLREMIGASEIVEGLSAVLFPELLTGMGMIEGWDYEYLSQAAGGVRMLFSDKERACEVARIFPLLCDPYSPGLQILQAVLPVGPTLMGTIEAGESSLAKQRNLATPILPPAATVSRRSPRTASAAVERVSQRGGGDDLVDEETLRKIKEGGDAARSLIARVAPDGFRKTGEWPFDFDEIAGHSGYLAIIHADANGLGNVLAGVRAALSGEQDLEKACAAYRAFSRAVQESTETAAREAFDTVIGIEGGQGRRFPLRPVVCAGDDLTVVIRADLAIPYTRRFLEAFERESKARLSPLGIGCESGMTACAGVAFVKKHYPYWRAYELCESLCRYAKKEVSRSASALAFWRLTTSLGTDYENTVLRKELAGDGGTCLTLNPYRIGNTAVPGVGPLLDLVSAMKELSSGGLRRLMTSVYTNKEMADRDFERALSIMGEKGCGWHKQAFCEALQSLGCARGSMWDREGKRTPLLDAIELNSVDTRIPEVKA